jgi:hypothetical protein
MLSTPRRSVALLRPRKVARSIPPGLAARVHRMRSKAEETNCPNRKTETPDPMVKAKIIIFGFENAAIGCVDEERYATTVVPVSEINANKKNTKLIRFCCHFVRRTIPLAFSVYLSSE